MPSTFFGLNIGTTGLYTYQAALNTTGHNVSNAETEGYTRQILYQKAGVAIKVNSTYGMAGSGVDVTGVLQKRSEYYDLKYRKNNTISGGFEAKQFYLTEVENYLNEVSLNGFTTSFNKLNDSLQSLSTSAADMSKRSQVTNYAKNLAEYFNSLSNSLKSIQEECNFEIKNQVDRINSLGQQIATMTKQINTLEAGGGKANDLRDQRNLLLDDLSKIVNISTSESIVGNNVGITSFTVKINGQTLVDTDEYNTLKVVPRENKVNQNDADGLYEIQWNSSQSFDTSSTTLGGYLQALFEVRDGNNDKNLSGTFNGAAGTNTLTLTGPSITAVEKINIPPKGVITIGNQEYKYDSFTYNAATKEYTFTLDSNLTSAVAGKAGAIGKSIDYKGIPYYMGQLNEFVRTYAKAFNDIHKSGKDLNGDTGIDFFNGTDVNGNNYTLSTPESYYNLTAANFTVTDSIYNNPGKLAIAGEIINGVENKKVLDSLLAIKSNTGLFKQGTPASFVQSLVAEIGTDSKKASEYAKNQSDILDMVTNQRLSVSGVDTEEEAMNLIRFQNAYNLSAKVIQTMNEVYDKLINGTGV